MGDGNWCDDPHDEIDIVKWAAFHMLLEASRQWDERTAKAPDIKAKMAAPRRLSARLKRSARLITNAKRVRPLAKQNGRRRRKAQK